MQVNLLLVSTMAALAFTARASTAQELPLHGETVVRFATSEEAAEVLGRRDRFIRAMSRFDRQVRLDTTDDVTEADVIQFFKEQALDWDETEIAKVKPVVQSMSEKLSRLRVPLPKTVLLVLATGKVETGYAHCRENAIVIPRHVLNREPDQLERLLVHEMFHIVSSHHRQLRRQLYAIVGFTPTGDIELPASLKDRKIANPDAPTVDCYIEVTADGKKYLGAPVIYANVQQYNPQQQRKLMQYVTFRLMAVERVDGEFHPVLKDGRAVVFDPAKLDSFFAQIGRNTSYIIHPDEILADNFVRLVMGDTNLATPRIVDEMAKLIGK